MWIVAEATKGCRQRISWLKHNDNIGREIRERERVKLMMQTTVRPRDRWEEVNAEHREGLACDQLRGIWLLI